MSRKFLIPLLAAAFFAAPTAMTGLSDSAMAQKPPKANAVNLNASRSNIYRMGGGGGKGAASRTTTVKSSKSNTSDRMGGGGGGGPSPFAFGR